jgi:hypothetical protein
MRTKLLLSAAVLGVAGMLTASAQVYSVNVVGYVNVDLVPGFNLIANPLDNTSSDNDLNTLIPTAGFGDTVFKYNGTAFESSIYFGTWDPNLTFAPGEGFFIQVAEAATITFVGEVLQGAESNMSLPAGLSLIGSKVPQELSLDAAGFPADFGDSVYFFRNGAYEASLYFGTFDPPAVPAVGEGFWVQKAATGEWDRNFEVQ